MPTLHFGVIDQLYKDEENGIVKTTGQVATELELKYHVMEVFFDKYEKEIEEILEAEMTSQFEQLLSGKRPLELIINTFKIEELFKKYLSRDEWQKITGRIIQTALQGVSKRFKDRFNLKKKRGPRPAFIDTGLYQASFKAWIDK